MSLDSACDAIAGLDLPGRQYGIPALWPKAAPQLSKSPREHAYYALSKDLAAAVNKLVYLHHHAELRRLDRAAVGALYRDTVAAEPLAALAAADVAPFLASMVRFKADALTADYLTMALPVLRSVYQENTSLTDAEFTVLNNLKKLYSHYNDHAANLRRLLPEYHAHKQLAGEEAALAQQTAAALAALRPRLAELRELHTDLQALENTYRNRLAGDTDAAVLRASQRTLAAFATRTATISVLCDLLPNMVLCHASSWHSDRTLRGVVEDCQAVAERLAALPEIPRDLLSADLEAMVF